jgi:uncharacterized protein YecE (DUF72 family)
VPGGIVGRMAIRVGTSGWVYRDWRGAFYPDGLPQRLWLEYYATQFDTVEVNNAFHGCPRTTTSPNGASGSPTGSWWR